MKWMKYHHRWASGHNSGDCYRELADYELQDGEVHSDTLDDICRENAWSDKYRGIKYEIVDYPPIDWLENRVERAVETAKAHMENAHRLRAILAEARLCESPNSQTNESSAPAATPNSK